MIFAPIARILAGHMSDTISVLAPYLFILLTPFIFPFCLPFAFSYYPEPTHVFLKKLISEHE